jgi:hypothetical protein
MENDQGLSVFDIKFITDGKELQVMIKKSAIFWYMMKKTNQDKVLNETCEIIVESLRSIALEIEEKKEDFFKEAKH